MKSTFQTWADNLAAGRYEVKCDDCKTNIGWTDSVRVSAEGGHCEECRRINDSMSLMYGFNLDGLITADLVRLRMKINKALKARGVL